MTTITIPEKIIKKGDLVVIPRKEYEEFNHWRKAVKVRLNERWFWTPEWQKKEAGADSAIRSGKIYGPFSNHKELIAALKRKRK